MTKLKRSPVRAKIKQDYNINLRMNLTGLKFEDYNLNAKCTPRNSAQINDNFKKFFPGFSKGEIEKFLSFDKDIMKWIKASPKNKKLLFENPIKALQSSGVKLDRSLLKKLTKVKNANDKRTQIAPGINFNKVEFSTKRTVLSKEFHELKKINKK